VVFHGSDYFSNKDRALVACNWRRPACGWIIMPLGSHLHVS
jgi:hypothetical protein